MGQESLRGKSERYAGRVPPSGATDTAWWNDYCVKGLIKFVRGRLKFGHARNSAPFPSAIVIFADLDSSPRGDAVENVLFDAA